jgi:hypothetical protein
MQHGQLPFLLRKMDTDSPVVQQQGQHMEKMWRKWGPT